MHPYSTEYCTSERYWVLNVGFRWSTTVKVSIVNLPSVDVIHPFHAVDNSVWEKSGGALLRVQGRFDIVLTIENTTIGKLFADMVRRCRLNTSG